MTSIRELYTRQLYRPKTGLERQLFPCLGIARITRGIEEYVGKVGVIIQQDDECARIAFSHFWDRSDGVDPAEMMDNTWVLTGEYEII